MKKYFGILSLVLSITLSLGLFINSYAANSEVTFEIPTTEQEAIEFIQENNIEVPEQFINDEKIGKLSLKLIEDVYYQQDSYSFNYAPILNFSKSIKDTFVNENLIKPEKNLPMARATYQLEDSTIYGSWDDSYANYNCYAYAIDKTDDFYNPGEFSDTYIDYDSKNVSISTVASAVVDDLDKLGYNAYYTTSKPSSIGSDETLICVRKGSELINVGSYEFWDYHFMLYTSDEWRHKPGETQILKYNYSDAAHKVWNNECVDSLGTVHKGTYDYNSKVKYIVFSER